MRTPLKPPLPPHTRGPRRTLALALLLAPAPALAAEEPPKLRAGQWEIATRLPGMPPPYDTVRGTMCLDDAVQQRWSVLSQKPQPGAQCDPGTSTRGADGAWRFSQTCTLEGRRVTTAGEARGDFTSRYEVTATTTGLPPTPGLPDRGEMRLGVTGRHTGACRGLRPGQMSVMGQIVPLE